MIHPRSKRLGFTILEMVVVLGIIAIGMGIAVFTITRSRESLSVEKALMLLRSRVERAQSLAAVAGSRMGTTRLVVAPPCVAGPTRHLWVQIDPAGTAIIPATVEYDGNTDVMTVRCDTFALTTQTNGNGLFAFPTAATLFGFTTDGHVVVTAGPPTVFVSLRQRNGGKRFGFRVLPSGIFCSASEPTRQKCEDDS